MRTITGTDFSISAPDAYTFIFAPNIITVTLGSSYAVDEVVTLAGNGLTFSRLAINRVVKFDMMPIFESKFPNTDFNIHPASAVADPFFAASFNCTVTVDGNNATIPFSLRWGAIQLDEAISYADIRFPFWPTMPLVVNSHLEHYYWAHNVGAGANGATPVIIPISTSTGFTYTITNGTLIQNTVFYPATCPTDGRYLSWIDQHGRVWSFMFEKNRMQGIQSDISKSGSIRRFPVDYTDSATGRELATKKDKQRSFQCYATVDNDIYDIIASVVASPFVHWYTSGRWVRVQIQPVQLAQQDGWMSDIEFTVELPKDYVQRL